MPLSPAEVLEVRRRRPPQEAIKKLFGVIDLCLIRFFVPGYPAEWHQVPGYPTGDVVNAVFAAYREKGWDVSWSSDRCGGARWTFREAQSPQKPAPMPVIDYGEAC